MAAQELGYELCRSKLAEVLEKIFKAELLRQGWVLERTHDLRKLGGELTARDATLGAEIRPLVAALAEAYFTARYPGFDFDDPEWPTVRALIVAGRSAAQDGASTPLRGTAVIQGFLRRMAQRRLLGREWDALKPDDWLTQRGRMRAVRRANAGQDRP